MGPEKFEANINPTSDGLENFYDSLADTDRHDISAKLSVGFQLLLEVELSCFLWEVELKRSVRAARRVVKQGKVGTALK